MSAGGSAGKGWFGYLGWPGGRSKLFEESRARYVCSIVGSNLTGVVIVGSVVTHVRWWFGGQRLVWLLGLAGRRKAPGSLFAQAPPTASRRRPAPASLPPASSPARLRVS